LKEYEGKLDLEPLIADVAPSLSVILDAVASAKCVLTDTYHLAVISWSLGVPALLVRGEHWENDFNAAIDKRYIFYIQHSLQEFFLPSSKDHEATVRFFENAVKLVEGGDSVRFYIENVKQKVEFCGRALIAALSE
jgi:hypothetical protein